MAERKRAEEALRNSEQEKTAILGTMSENVVYRDRKMRFYGQTGPQVNQLVWLLRNWWEGIVMR